MSEDLLLRREFDRTGLPLLRALVTESAIRAGLAGGAVGAFVHAALEIATNAVVHGGGHGTLEVRLTGGELRCRVTDRGPGLTERATEGHGLRLAEALTGPLELHGGPGRLGTSATLAVRV
ncbi:ATP-binding protein [Streptomyces sp. NPDC001536]|uniref:ATP-binding protein n=1 Tax=Streptomyces sp. NPDC001536 TaxID=3364583 RepID=UPI0036C5386C